METLRIYYCDFWPEFRDSENFIEPILKKHFNIILDQNNPDVLFHSIFDGMKETSKFKCKKFLFLGENRRPGKFGSDFSISFDPHSETNYRLPLWQVFLLKEIELQDRIFGNRRIRWPQEEFKKFAAFIVSNPTNFIRNSAFIELNKYKQVNSYGKYLTNDNSLIEYSEGKYWRDAKDSFFLQIPHKFMFAFENSPYPGYCTEKIMDAFLVGSIPLYNGDPKIKKDWNPKAFINTMYNTDWISLIKELDSDPNRFNDMYYQPIFTPGQKQKHLDNMNGFGYWLIKNIKNG